MKISARNVLKGKVKSMTPGAVNSEVTIALPGGLEVVAIITKRSAKSLGLKKGKPVCWVRRGERNPNRLFRLYTFVF